jgi:ABC-type multidrug transport system ATPase subunit
MAEILATGDEMERGLPLPTVVWNNEHKIPQM